MYKGESLNRIARRVAPSKVHGFDTFTGLPQAWRSGYPQGAFDVSRLNLQFEPNCVLHKGLFSNTLPTFLRDFDGQAKLIHVDCDLYKSTHQALTLLRPRIKEGTVIVFDEYFNYPEWENHEYKAFSEFMTDTGLGCRYLAYNARAQQVAIVISR